MRKAISANKKQKEYNIFFHKLFLVVSFSIIIGSVLVLEIVFFYTNIKIFLLQLLPFKIDKIVRKQLRKNHVLDVNMKSDNKLLIKRVRFRLKSSNKRFKFLPFEEIELINNSFCNGNLFFFNLKKRKV
ncbi:hypothetical protein B0A62_11125 [Flavobacterium hydatis]|uniref:Transmembrane protein n=1 Tax=Flavobacterium hydatis TaxID=991 RepID=A0A085ZTX5_FLAHY|nr:hypothetical protein IW20_23940 [Flavobacterium hydatis]OXA94202.1 hypothetical protein B0A62_11125 [Flavobacterium hydatis]